VFGGNTILGDGSVIMIIDPNGVARQVGSTHASDMTDTGASENRAEEAKSSFLLFRAGSPHPKAVPLALVTRLEMLDARAIEMSNGRHMVQYRGQLMPLVTLNDGGAVKSDGTQPLLVFSDGGHSIALAVDQIIDIVEDHLNIEIASDTPGVIGSAIIKGQATEIVDVGHFMPLAVADWFRGSGASIQQKPRSLLLVDDSPFFRNMLAPVLQAAGYRVTAVARADEAMALLRSGQSFDVVVTDIQMPEMDGFEFVAAMRETAALAETPVIALSSVVSDELVQRGRDLGLRDYVAKFDRAGLIAALKEHAANAEAA
jgi:two-component system chemotaxis sensor kinase CheA